jgi:hypothetical protein
MMHQAHDVLVSHDNRKGNPDMCVLWVPTLGGNDMPRIKLSKSSPKVGEELFYMGSPGGVYHPPVVPIFKGIFSGVINPSSSLITAPAHGGSSGAAILTPRNEIVGVLWAVHPEFHHITIISSFEATKIFFKTAKNILSRVNEK